MPQPFQPKAGIGHCAGACLESWRQGLFTVSDLVDGDGGSGATVDGLALTLFAGSAQSIGKFGLGFFFHTNWDPVAGDFGAMPFIFGTIVCSFLGLLIALPLSLGWQST